MEKGKFCPKCGKNTENVYENLCIDCFKDKIKLPDDFPSKMKINNCKMCGDVLIGKKKFQNNESAIQYFLQEIFKKKKIEYSSYRISKNTIFLTIKIKNIEVEKNIDKNISITYKRVTCYYCGLKVGNYWNAIVQIRSPKNIIKDVVNDVEKIIIKRNENDRYSFISKIEKKPEGVDLFIGSKSAISYIVKYVKSKYNIKTKLSRTFFGPVQGKKVYRDTILISVEGKK